jgi:hypothetical protein
MEFARAGSGFASSACTATDETVARARAARTGRVRKVLRWSNVDVSLG